MGFMGNRMGFIRPGKHTVKAIEHGPVEIVFPLKMVIHQRVRFTKLFRSSVRPPVWFSSMGPMSPRPSSLHLWRRVAPVPSHPPRWRWRPTLTLTSGHRLRRPRGNGRNIAFIMIQGDTLWFRSIMHTIHMDQYHYIYMYIYRCMYIYIYIYQ